MPYKILKHTADIRVLIEGNSFEELFSDALAALMDILRPGAGVQKKIKKREIAVRSEDETTILVDFLNEVLFNAYNHKEAYDKVDFRSLKENSLEATLYGRAVQSFGEDVKAVTYHEAEVKKDNKGKWRTYLVLDV